MPERNKANADKTQSMDEAMARSAPSWWNELAESAESSEDAPSTWDPPPPLPKLSGPFLQRDAFTSPSPFFVSTQHHTFPHDTRAEPSLADSSQSASAPASSNPEATSQTGLQAPFEWPEEATKTLNKDSVFRHAQSVFSQLRAESSSTDAPLQPSALPFPDETCVYQPAPQYQLQSSPIITEAPARTPRERKSSPRPSPLASSPRSTDTSRRSKSSRGLGPGYEAFQKSGDVINWDWYVRTRSNLGGLDSNVPYGVPNAKSGPGPAPSFFGAPGMLGSGDTKNEQPLADSTCIGECAAFCNRTADTER